MFNTENLLRNKEFITPFLLPYNSIVKYHWSNFSTALLYNDELTGLNLKASTWTANLWWQKFINVYWILVIVEHDGIWLYKGERLLRFFRSSFGVQTAKTLKWYVYFPGDRFHSKNKVVH